MDAKKEDDHKHEHTHETSKVAHLLEDNAATRKLYFSGIVSEMDKDDDDEDDDFS